jgi:hypothetical protein
LALAVIHEKGGFGGVAEFVSKRALVGYIGLWLVCFVKSSPQSYHHGFRICDWWIVPLMPIWG